MANKPKLFATPELNTMLTPNRLAKMSVTFRPSIKLTKSPKPTKVIPKEELTPEEADYYDYTCHTGDVIKSMMLVSPDKNIEDLKREKRILELL
ncbi:hypothetical protein [Phocaeicola plebeius]|uniref:hypothetical protein n=1 Tax=Phocaeicola plebeius TaxID=310297 RepID=UPI003990F8F3